MERTYSSPNRAVPRLTLSQNEEIVKLYQDGMRPADIARKLGTTEWTVHHRLNRTGVKRRIVGLSLSEILEAQRLYESGESLRQIGLKIGFNDKTVKKALINAGVDVQDRRRKN